MPAIALRAHFDGTHICLDERFDLPPNAQLLVTVLPPLGEDEKAMYEFAEQGLTRAYGEDEPEYTLADVKS